MTPKNIKPGMKFGNWEVIKFDHVNNHRVKYFLCKCLVCGTIRPVRSSVLINGTSTACSKTCSSSLLNQTFGEWKVLRVDKSQPRNYICKCSCGTVKSVYGGSLKQGTSKSCGCRKISNTKERFEKQASEHIGEVHGLLTITGYEKRGDKYWYHCNCECGNTTTIIGTRLLADNGTKSCGCINSKANMEMAKILDRYNIPYKREYRFEDCKDKNTLPFDFALFNREDELIGLIENNGEQHYSSSGTGWFTPERMIEIQKHDYIKRKFSEDNKIPFLIIPYQFFDELEKFLITSDFWQIIIKNFND